MTKRTWTSIQDAETHSFQAWYSDLLETYKRERHFLRGSGLWSTSLLQIRKYILAAELDGVRNPLRALVLDAMISASQTVPGSDVWLPYALSDRLTVEDQKYASSSVYVDCVSEYTHSQTSKDIFKTVIDLCGPLTGISVRLGEYNEPFIRYKSSYSFPISPCAMFVQTVGKATGFELFSPEVLMIEGAPATLSEIEPLIYRSVESSRPIVLIARHFPEEVSATLATNWRNGKLKILPLTYGSEVNSINLAADMITATGGELVSTHFGDIIPASCSNDEKYGEIERIEVTSRGIDIDSDRDTSRQIQHLLSVLEDTEEEALQELLSNRIHSLTNDSIEVNIPKSDPKLHEELDMMFKHYSAFVQHGMSKTQLGWIPASIVRVVNEIADSTDTELKRIGGFLLEA
jgi:hypothetical protein